jgi:hypothetical protein
VHFFGVFLQDVKMNINTLLEFLRSRFSWRSEVAESLLSIPGLNGFAIQNNKIVFFAEADLTHKIEILQRLLPITFNSDSELPDAAFVPLDQIVQLHQFGEIRGSRIYISPEVLPPLVDIAES